MRAVDQRSAVMLAAIVVIWGCAGDVTPPASEEDQAAAAAVGTVEVSSYPLAWVVERLAGPLVDVRFRAADAPDPAYWKPTAEEVLAMQQADLIVLNGASYEGWLDDVSLPTSRIIDTTAGVRDRLIAVAESVTHSHGPEGEHEHTGAAFTTWLDPTLLADQARAVRDALGARWPQHDALFSDRLAGVIADLESLDAELAAATARAAGEPVTFSHPVYQYLARRYGLRGDSVHWEPDAVPDDTQWAEIEHLLDHAPARWMIWEAAPHPETRQALAERGLGVVVVSPCATPPEDGDFLDVMRANARALEAAFAAPE